MASSNGTVNYITDGYTQNVYFREIPGIYGEFRGRFRPPIGPQYAQIQRDLQMAEDDWEKRQWVAFRWMAQLMVDWNIKKPDGAKVDHRDVKEYDRIPISLRNRLWSCILNQDGGDIDPDVSPYEANARAAREQAVSMAGHGKSPSEVMEGN